MAADFVRIVLLAQARNNRQASTVEVGVEEDGCMLPTGHIVSAVSVEDIVGMADVGLVVQVKNSH